jgi:hypothetical protein
LAKRKAKCGHGKWIRWLMANVEFTEATACNYIRLFENAEWLKSKNVLDLTDARLQLKAKSKAEGAKPRGRGSQKPSKERCSGIRQEAIGRLHALWYRNDNGRTLPMRDGDLQRWVDKVEVIGGETTETIAQEAYRLWKLSIPTPELKNPDVPTDDPSPIDSTDVQEPDDPPESQEHYLLQTLEGITVYVTDSDDYKFEFNLEARGLPVRVPKDPTLLPVVEEVLGVECQWVLAPEPPVASQEAPTADSDDSSPAEPLVPVERPEEGKRTTSPAPILRVEPDLLAKLGVANDAKSARKALNRLDEAVTEWELQSEPCVKDNRRFFALREYTYATTSCKPPVETLKRDFDEFYNAILNFTYLTYAERDLLYQHIRRTTESKYA